jgi:DNA invertase Pin-like site-specific DNA recombinase
MLPEPAVTDIQEWTLVLKPLTLVVAKLDRLSHSMLDFACLMATAQKQNWALVALDCAVDTSTPAGEAMAHVLATPSGSSSGG